MMILFPQTAIHGELEQDSRVTSSNPSSAASCGHIEENQRSGRFSKKKVVLVKIEGKLKIKPFHGSESQISGERILSNIGQFAQKRRQFLKNL